MSKKSRKRRKDQEVMEVNETRETSETPETGEAKESRLKEIVQAQVENEEAEKAEVETSKNRKDTGNSLLSKEEARMNVKQKTRGAEIMAIFARHNFYAGGLTPVELRTTLEDLGPTYVKIGQIMSSRTDLLPESYCEELVKLRQSVQPLDPEVARAVIEQETGKKIEDIYSEFRNEPLGSASIGQVHYGVLRDGTRVVTKVQRPFIVEMTEQDFELLKKLAGIVNVVVEGDDSGSLIDLVSVIEELEKVTKEEIDFTNEARNTRLFREKCIEDESVVSCPEIIDELTTSKILTMTFVDGYSISHKERIEKDGYLLTDVGEKIVRSYVHQVLDVGIFHADPHQGNIMFSEGRPFWIDFGMLGTISESNINLISGIVLGVIQGDAESLASVAMSTGKVSEKTDRSRLMQDLDSFLERFMTGTSISDVNVDEMLSSFADLTSRNYITLPSEFTMLLRSLIMIEGVIEELCPELNLFEILSGKFMDRAKKNFDLKQSLIEIGTEALSMGRKAAKIPSLCADALKDIVKGNMKVKLELTGYDPLMKALEDTVRNIILAVFACVIFFGSCIMCLTHVGPVMAGDIPLFAFSGFVFSIALGIYAVKQMNRH